MKLDKNLYFNAIGEVDITEKGWLDLYEFCKSILYKQYCGKLSADVLEDLVSISLLACVDNLTNYDEKKNNQLGGYLYWIVRGEVTKYMQKKSREVCVDMTSKTFMEWMEGEQDGYC